MSIANNELNKLYERPWGTYQTIALAEGYQVKVITVYPGGKLSLQKHFHRAEHWVIVQGSLLVTLDDAEQTLGVNQHIYIPIESIHRVENQTEETAQLVEVQVGDYLGEDDIVRLEDVYGRE